MTTVKTLKVVDLDEQWVSDILINAFDYAHGSCNYWLVQGGVERIGDFRGIEPLINKDDHWLHVELKGSTGSVIVGKNVLNAACNSIINNPPWEDTDVRNELLAALATPNEPPHLPDFACDVIVQVGLYYQPIYTK